MHPKTLHILLAMARHIPPGKLISWSGKSTVFPFYHTISPKQLAHISHLYRVITPEDFERDLDQLLKWFEPLSMAEYLAHSANKRRRPAMVLTFDDGLKECYNYIAPLLKKKGIPASFFLNNQFIGNRGLFYRYKASLLVHRVKEDCRSKQRAAAFLKIEENHVEESILMVGYRQQALLDALAVELELDFSAYLLSSPVYMTTGDVKELIGWGFDIGGHSSDHIDFTTLDPEGMIEQVTSSLADLQKRFGTDTGYFSFPFTSDGVPEKVINKLLDEEAVTALMGSGGLKRTGKAGFIQRVPMEKYEAPADDALKAEYLYYMLKRVLGRDRHRY